MGSKNGRDGRRYVGERREGKEGAGVSNVCYSPRMFRD